MQIDIKIITDDHELALDLVESTRFPERRPLIVPGEAVISTESSMSAADDSFWSSDVINLIIDINEDTSVETFANWFYGKLEARMEKIMALAIAGKDTEVDEGQILQAIKDGLKSS